MRKARQYKDPQEKVLFRAYMRLENLFYAIRDGVSDLFDWLREKLDTPIILLQDRGCQLFGTAAIIGTIFSLIYFFFH